MPLNTSNTEAEILHMITTIFSATGDFDLNPLTRGYAL